LAVADETAQMMEPQSQLEAKSAELTRTARQLRAANDKLTQLSVQKDAFLSQISHELRTPMTSIRSFSEILRDGEGLEQEQLSKYANIIHQEAIRLTRLLDDLLDLSVLENGQVSLNVQSGSLQALIDHALASTGVEAKGLRIHTRGLELDLMLETDLDRLSQVFINLIANAHKYCDAPRPALTIRAAQRDNHLVLDFTDNGSGVPRDKQDLIFEKFARVSDQKAGGAGLGLAICREIMARLGGAITYLPGQGGASFRVTLPMRMRQAAE
jgi:signal transduction histidine kinase